MSSLWLRGRHHPAGTVPRAGWFQCRVLIQSFCVHGTKETVSPRLIHLQCHLFGRAFDHLFSAARDASGGVSGTKETMQPPSNPPACRLFGCSTIWRSGGTCSSWMLSPSDMTKATVCTGTFFGRAAAAGRAGGGRLALTGGSWGRTHEVHE